MADHSHFFKNIHKVIGGDDSWMHKPSKIDFIHTSPRFKDYSIEKISIDDLIRDNDLNNPTALNNHPELWSPTKSEDDIHPDQFKYKEDLDNDPYDVIYGTRKLDGSVKLGNGRHRVRALKNNGINYVTIPITEELMDAKDPYYKAFRDDFYGDNIPALNKWIRFINYSGFPKEQATFLKHKLHKRIEYLKLINDLNKRR